MKNYFKTIQKFLYGGSARLNLDTSLTPDYSSVGTSPQVNLELSDKTKSNIGYLNNLELSDPSFAATRAAARVNSIKSEVTEKTLQNLLS